MDIQIQSGSTLPAYRAEQVARCRTQAAHARRHQAPKNPPTWIDWVERTCLRRPFWVISAASSFVGSASMCMLHEWHCTGQVSTLQLQPWQGTKQQTREKSAKYRWTVLIGRTLICLSYPFCPLLFFFASASARLLASDDAFLPLFACFFFNASKASCFLESSSASA